MTSIRVGVSQTKGYHPRETRSTLYKDLIDCPWISSFSITQRTQRPPPEQYNLRTLYTFKFTMRFFLAISALLAVATAAPASTAQNLQDVQNNAAAFTEAKKAAGCDWLGRRLLANSRYAIYWYPLIACVSSLAGESAACAAAAAELGASMLAISPCQYSKYLTDLAF